MGGWVVDDCACALLRFAAYSGDHIDLHMVDLDYMQFLAWLNSACVLGDDASLDLAMAVATLLSICGLLRFVVSFILRSSSLIHHISSRNLT